MAAGLFAKLLAPVFAMFGFLFGVRGAAMDAEEAAWAAQEKALEELEAVEAAEIGDGEVIELPDGREVHIGEGRVIEIVPTEPADEAGDE